MEIYLIRHTTPDVAKGVCYGQANIGVTSTFKDEFTQIKSKLPLNKKVVIYSSPLFRCYKLASELASDINTSIFLDSRLKEVNFGTWENKAWDDIPKEEIDPWMKKFVTEKPPMGESYIELQTRVIDFFITTIKKETESTKSIFIVAHAGPIRSWLAHIQQIDLKDSFDIKVEYGQVIKLNYQDSKFSLVQ